ncbi:hypothetical protein ZIOFF_019348 [Zingiber officinale]|uniref:Uncharacterized protein n=1 Tax=Zingiber officinale TaxID=94328 RepID=A0A8J5LST8_ZINOF|nr:hypothetical protein ZIOFF_019348 [Zingiber officinale]
MDWYYFSKILAEYEALDYAEKHEDVVTVGASLVVGPLLQSTMNSSSLYLINLIKGVRRIAENRDIYLVDVRDVVDALLLVYKDPKATGRHICASHSLKLRNLVTLSRDYIPTTTILKSNATKTIFFHFTQFMLLEDFCDTRVMDSNMLNDSSTEVEESSVVRSEKLKNLGWNHRTLEETLVDNIKSIPGQASRLLLGQASRPIPSQVSRSSPGKISRSILGQASRLFLGQAFRLLLGQAFRLLLGQVSRSIKRKLSTNNSSQRPPFKKMAVDGPAGTIQAIATTTANLQGAEDGFAPQSSGAGTGQSSAPGQVSIVSIGSRRAKGGSGAPKGSAVLAQAWKEDLDAGNLLSSLFQ